ncbi:TIR domain-containing protein [Jannaschia sp. R86511]|uniref:TIR domain-containing protein n=1 Tax=Jannaschia sp. R86511 TaxID=3093853 RepID=UPI0036D3E8D8
MGHKVFISFKAEDMAFKDAIGDIGGIDYVDKSLKEPIDSLDQDYIMSKIRSDYLYDSTVTVFLIGNRSNENLGVTEQYFIKKELQASLYTTSAHYKSGILGVVLPSMSDTVYGGSYECWRCNASHSLVRVNDSTTIREFSYNYYLPNGRCSHMEEDRYCVMTSWDKFVNAPNAWIDAAFDKRDSPIASQTKVRP